jgi:GT2 family glycosyltransferase
MAESQWIAFLDSDDAWHKDKLKKQVDFHKKNRDILISYTDEKWIRDGLHVKVAKKFAKSHENLYERSLSHCIIAPSSVMIEKKLFERVGGFDESLEVCEDYDLWLRILKQEYKIALIDEPLIDKYGGNQDQLSTKYWGMDRFRIRSLEALHVKYKDDKKLLHVMIKKYDLLLKGAKKHERHDDAFHYEQRLEELRSLTDL